MYDWSTGAEGAPTAAASVSVVVERMYDWSRTVCRFWSREYSCFSCCWKDVRLKPESTDLPSKLKRFQLLLKGCTIEAAMESRFMKSWTVSVVVERMYDWSSTMRMATKLPQRVSVVVERMYDWSSTMRMATKLPQQVSVVVERMYDWSSHSVSGIPVKRGFSCCWKDVRLKPERLLRPYEAQISFSCCWKDVRLKRRSVWAGHMGQKFQLLLKGCTIEAERSWGLTSLTLPVSVVVERMYDWSSLTMRKLLPARICFSCCWKDVRLKQEWGKKTAIAKSCFSCCWKDVRLKHKRINT